MPWLVDGANVLGADRMSDDAKRHLVRLAAQLARARRTRVTVVFDGVAPTNFATHLGAVSIVFSGSRSADDVIAERATGGRGWNVVTSDRGLAARVRGRQVSIVEPREFLAAAEASAGGESRSADEDWDAWFSDPQNRLKF